MKNHHEYDIENNEIISNSGRGYADIRDCIHLSRIMNKTEIRPRILERSFPASIHEDILQAVGLDFDKISSRAKIRDPHFRERILRAYQYQCAVCGFNVRVGDSLVALEAAHIKCSGLA